jgi:hypothetical protein
MREFVGLKREGTPSSSVVFTFAVSVLLIVVLLYLNEYN